MAKTEAKIKIAPNSKESEMMVLGCMLTNINSLNIAADSLNESDFYYTEHKLIFDVLKTAYRNDKPADIHLVAEELKRKEQLEKVGGVSYLTALAQYAGTSAYIEEYVRIIHDKSILRSMITCAQKIEKTALEEPADVHIALDDAQGMFFTISQTSASEPGIAVKDLLSGLRAESGMPYLKELQERQEYFREHGEDEHGITGIPTHFQDLDLMINGLNDSNLNILAARPAMGKTALALNIAENICFKSKIPVAIFSLEMDAEQLLHRIICSQSEVESKKIQNGSLSGHEYQRIVATVKMMQEHTMIIDDQPGLRISDLRARARRLKESYNVGLIVIDYLQLLSGSSSYGSSDNRQSEISEISRMLKNLARELNIPILCLSQLSRRVEERQGHRPMMSDLRESGCLAGETLIKDAETGALHTIKELAERKEQVPITIYGIDASFKLGKHVMSRVFYSGKKSVYFLKTRTGRTIKASANHPFLKLEGWTRLDLLKKGDRIGLPRSYKIANTNDEGSKHELSLLAHLLGDGCILPKQPYHYTSADDENIRTVSEAVHALFGIQPKIVKQKNWKHLYLPSPFKLTHEKKHPITSWFEQLGLDRVHSYKKKLPASLFEKSKNQIQFFLKHLWATDGNISSKITSGRKPSAAIYYATSSKILAQQVQHLLLCLDIQSTIATQPSKKGYRDMHHVRIQGKPNQQRFLQTVNSAGKRGENTATFLSQLATIESNTNYDVIPKEAWNSVVKEAKEAANLSWRAICKDLCMSYGGSSLFKSGISRNRMEKLHASLKDDRLNYLATSDVYWDEIISIEHIGEEDVYDATVPGVHNFVANDIIVHNSIEQDADIVMFLLRREYYDPYDKPGMAELIVGKNRHGKVGSVNLTYRKEITQFANYSESIEMESDEGNSNAFAAFSPQENS